MRKRRGDWIETYTGIKFWPLDPRPEEIRIEDIARALSNQCRFAGHVQEFYSVAQHSVLVAEHVHDGLWGLLHDAAEAYLGDFQRPLKHNPEFGVAYRKAERRLMRAVAKHFGLSWPEPADVKQADALICINEARQLKNGDTSIGFGNPNLPLIDRIMPFPPKIAEWKFLEAYEIWK